MKNLFDQTFSSERLTLQSLITEDASFIQQLTNSPGWLEYIGNRKINNEEDAKNYIQKIAEMPEANYWKIVEKKNGKAVGVITLIKRDYLNDYDIGYALLPDYEGQGFAYEGSVEILEHAIGKSSQGVIYAVTKKVNIKSIKLLEKIGLSYARTLDLDGDIVELYEIRK